MSRREGEDPAIVMCYALTVALLVIFVAAAVLALVAP